MQESMEYALRPIRRPQDAEHNTAVWLRQLGFVDAETTQQGPDGGVDVRGSGIIAQVKAETAPVGLQVVQALFGCAAAESVTGAFFSLSGFTPKALAWAEMAGLALFDFDLMGDAVALNAAALQLNQIEGHLDEASARAALADELISRGAELAEEWGLSRDPTEGRCIVGLVDRLDEEPVWAEALSRFVAAWHQTLFRIADGSDLLYSGDVASVLSSLEEGEVLCVSRFDQMPLKAREFLASAHHRNLVNVIVGKGPGATAIPLKLEPFILIVTAPRAWAQADLGRTRTFQNAEIVRLPYASSFVHLKA
jgi:Restriction endonuclease/Holliday junction DNA helicase RuvB P-loop domain